MRYFLLTAFFLGLSGCATSPLDTFKGVEVGMSKSQLVEDMGGPYFKVYVGDRYIWRYKMYRDNQTIIKEVHIKDGYVSYVGDTLTRKEYQFLKVHNENKDFVLKLLGIPSFVAKRSGKETWVYVLSKKTGMAREVTFQNDRVVGVKKTISRSEFSNI